MINSPYQLFKKNEWLKKKCENNSRRYTVHDNNNVYSANTNNEWRRMSSSPKIKKKNAHTKKNKKQNKQKNKAKQKLTISAAQIAFQ